LQGADEDRHGVGDVAACLQRADHVLQRRLPLAPGDAPGRAEPGQHLLGDEANLVQGAGGIDREQFLQRLQVRGEVGEPAL
jgi:hypothetical protein